MTEHEKLMLRRHLDAAVRYYKMKADADKVFSRYGLSDKTPEEWREHTEDAKLMIEKLTK